MDLRVKFLILFSNLHFLHARMGFVKDQSTTNIPFPPSIMKAFDSGIPTGHLRPLGWQRAPEGKVAEEQKMLSPVSFDELYVKENKPVVFRHAVTDVPATELWAKDEYLKKMYGDLEIHVVVKKELLKKGPKKMKFKKFLREYLYEDWYLSNTVPQEMMKELTLPHCLTCGYNSWLQESEIWMSSGGTNSLLHSHADHNLHCLLAGRKDFVLIKNNHADKVAFKANSAHPGAGFSDMDTEMVNMFKYAQVAQTPWTWSTLQPGDCIYVPAGYMHHVRSYGRSFSSTMLWSPSPETDFSECPKDQDPSTAKPTPLTEAPFLWTYTGGDRQLMNVRLHAPSLRHHLLVWARDQPTITRSLFEDIYKDIMPEASGETSVNTAWETLTGSKKADQISREDIVNMDAEVLGKVAKLLNKPHSQSHDEL